MNNFLDDKQNNNAVDLQAYASGDGSLSFVFQERHSCNVSGIPVSKRDALEYQKRHPHLADWKLVMLHGVPKLYRPVTRLTNDEVQIGGRSYRYVKIHEQSFQVFDSEGHETKNNNIVAAIQFFVNHEQELEDV